MTIVAEGALAAEAGIGRVLVTGAAGFIGFHAAARLLGDGMAVHGIDDLNAYYDPRLKEARLAELRRQEGFSFERLDIADHDALAKSFASFRPDVVIHLAAQAGVRHSVQHPFAYSRANLDGFLSVLEACRAATVRHLLYASSSSVYGSNAKVPFSEADPVEHPVSLYAATKRANEMMAEAYAHLYAIPMSGLRFFSVYGPWGRPDMAYYSFAEAIVAGRPIELYNGGRMSRDFTYVGDVAEAIVRLVPRPPVVRAPNAQNPAARHTIYNVGNHEAVSLGDFVTAIETALGKTADKRFGPMQPGDVPATFADVSRLQAAVGYAPQTPLNEGIARFAEWFRTYHGV